VPRGDHALAYIRVSVVGDRAAKGTLESPDLQRAQIDRKAEELGVTVVDELRDLNRSGGTLTRPGIQEALTRIHSGEAQGIIVARSDRASRITLQALGLIDELERAGAWIAAADGSLDTTDPNRKMATVMTLAVAERELERFREQSALIHRRAVIDKGRHMGPAPFGYTRDEAGRLVVDPDQAPIVLRVFRQRADGETFTALARQLDVEGVRQRTGRKVNALMLRRMVRRRVYLGEANHGPHVKPGAHPAIVDEATWTQANRASPSVRSSVAAPRLHEESLLRGMLRCAGCQYVMKRLPQRSGGFVWKCRSTLSERTATHDCATPARIRKAHADTVQAQVVEEFMRLAAGTGDVVQSEDHDDGHLAQEEAEAQAVLDELSSLEVRKRLGAERWLALTTEASRDLETKRQVRAVRDARAGAGPLRREDLAAAWEAMSLSERQRALRSVVQAVMVRPDETIAVIPVWEPIDLPRPGPHAVAPGPFAG
jgi:site-specific DNA recombinase